MAKLGTNILEFQQGFSGIYPRFTLNDIFGVVYFLKTYPIFTQDLPRVYQISKILPFYGLHFHQKTGKVWSIEKLIQPGSRKLSRTTQTL